MLSCGGTSEAAVDSSDARLARREDPGWPMLWALRRRASEKLSPEATDSVSSERRPIWASERRPALASEVRRLLTSDERRLDDSESAFAASLASATPSKLRGCPGPGSLWRLRRTLEPPGLRGLPDAAVEAVGAGDADADCAVELLALEVLPLRRARAPLADADDPVLRRRDALVLLRVEEDAGLTLRVAVLLDAPLPVPLPEPDPRRLRLLLLVGDLYDVLVTGGSGSSSAISPSESEPSVVDSPSVSQLTASTSASSGSPSLASILALW